MRADPVCVCNLCAESFAADRQRRWRKDGFDIVRCPRCGLLFRNTLPARHELDLIYAESYFARPSGDGNGQGYLDYVADELSHRETARRRLELLQRHLAPGKLLDVGAAALRSAAAALERSPLGGVRIPVNLRDIVTIVARKEPSRERA